MDEIEEKIKDFLDRNKLWKRVWSIIFGTVIMGFLMALILAEPVRWLWNSLVVHLIEGDIEIVRMTKYWSAVKLIFLIRLLLPVRWR